LIKIPKRISSQCPNYDPPTLDGSPAISTQ